MRTDVLVLGAGIIGVSVALHLQRAGRSVVLVDRQAGPETSFGNAGLIQREAAYPYAFPRRFRDILRYAVNRNIDAHIDWRALPTALPYLARYWFNSESGRHNGIARSYATLIEHCIDETRSMAEEAGASSLLRSDGWIKVFRNPRQQGIYLAEAARTRREFGIQASPLDQAALRQLEPDLDRSLVGGLHYTASDTVSDPGALVEAYHRLFASRGGQFLIGDAGSLERNGPRWRVATQAGQVEADHAVVALGPWSTTVVKRLGYDLPLGVMRGYHMHYEPRGATLHHPILDLEHGYMLVPTTRGVRLTTGAEFAHRDAPKTPVQLGRAEPVARSLFPLANRLDAEPWMGSRPCSPDMLPIIGPSPRHADLWFAFGHAHHGLTLGGVTGRLIAEMIVGVKPFVDPTPFRVDRPALRRSVFG